MPKPHKPGPYIFTMPNGHNVHLCDACSHDGGPGVRLCPLHAAAEEMRGILEAIVYSPAMVENDEPLMNEARALLAKVGP